MPSGGEAWKCGRGPGDATSTQRTFILSTENLIWNIDD
jgi:hypothetical protein